MVVFSPVSGGLWPFEYREFVSEDIVERIKVDVVVGVVVEFSAFAAGEPADRYVLW